MCSVEPDCLYFCVCLVSSFLVGYCDAVLKYLPDVKTMISLHQQLLKEKERAAGADPNSLVGRLGKLSAEDVLKNEGIFDMSVIEIIFELNRRL